MSELKSVKNLSGPKDLIHLLKEISVKIRVSEFHVLGEYSTNKYIPDSYDFTIKGIYNVTNHKKLDFPEGFPKKIYSVTKCPGADLKCYRFKNTNPTYFKYEEDTTKLIRVVEIKGKFGPFKTYFWDVDLDEDELKEIGDIDF